MILVKTPLRISLIGGSTDIEDFYTKYPGRCITAAINKYVYITISKKFEGDVRVSYSHTETVPTSKEIKNSRVRAVLEKLGIEKGMQIVSIGDLPGEGIGLASSSAFTVGLLNGVHKFLGNKVDAEQLAREACEIEIDVLKEPIGKQDQYATAYGGVNLINFNKDGVTVEPIYTKSFEEHLMFFYTGKTRSASAILSAQKLNFETNFEALKKVSDMVPIFHDKMLTGDWKGMGLLLHEAWMLKRELAVGITDDEIDKIYKAAREKGAWGGKIVGAGGGGFLMLMVEPSKQDAVRSVIPYQEVKFEITDRGSEIVYETIS